MVRRIDNIGNTVWTAYFGDSHATAGKVSNSVGFSIVQVRIHGILRNQEKNKLIISFFIGWHIQHSQLSQTSYYY